MKKTRIQPVITASVSYSIHISLLGAVPQILDRNIGKQRRNHPVAGFGFRLGNLDIQALGINIHVFGYNFDNIILYLFHDFGGAAGSVRYQQQF